MKELTVSTVEELVHAIGNQAIEVDSCKGKNNGKPFVTLVTRETISRRS